MGILGLFGKTFESIIYPYIDLYNIELIVHPKMTKDSGCCCKLLIFFTACNLHNSFLRTSLWVFLDSMESSLSLEYNHMLFNGIWCPHLV